MKTKRPTLRDVAHEAGVSYQTVSRVINDNTHVSPKTRSRVLKAIDTLGFKPNRAAQILQTERSHTIEVIIFYGGLNQFLVEMARTALKMGYHFVIAAITESEFAQTLESASSRFVDGLIIVPATPIDEDYDNLLQLTDSIPFVQIGAKLGAQVPSVIYDQAGGARLATQHLIDLGHRQIATIRGPHPNYDADDRHAGWLETLKDNHLTPGPCEFGDFSIDGGYQAMMKILDSGEPFTSVFTCNDSTAFGAHTALHKRGLRVPEDVSLVSFDDIPEAAHFTPALTTVQQDFRQIGHLAIEYLISLIEDPDTAIYQRVLPPRLIVRDSTRPLNVTP